MSRSKLFSLTVIVSLLLSLLASMALLAQAAPEPATGNFPQIADKPNLNPGLESLSPGTISTGYFIGATQSLPCNTYYLHRNEVNVGTDGVQKIANTTAPLAGAPAVASQQLSLLSGLKEIARFYSDPPLAADFSAGDITGSLWIQASQLNTAFKVEMFDYNPGNGSRILLGTYDFSLISTGQTEVEFNITPSATTIASGHRFLFVLSGKTNALFGSNVDLFYDSATRASRFIICQRTPPILAISKSGPTTASAGQPVTYILTVANSGDTTATNLVISDTIPSGASYVSGGTKVGNVVRWTAASLAPDASIQRTFIVTATATIVNSDYRVVADNNVSAVGQQAVVTTITNGPIKKLYLPTIFKSEPVTFLIVDSYETGGINPVRILDPSNNNELLSCVVGNNVKVDCGSFPAIGTYKIIAHTNNCGILQGTFHDAAPGATVTRRVHCQ
jgi:uncharacterized repeat protein (TIGR01451 family)